MRNIEATGSEPSTNSPTLMRVTIASDFADQQMVGKVFDKPLKACLRMANNLTGVPQGAWKCSLQVAQSRGGCCRKQVQGASEASGRTN